MTPFFNPNAPGHLHDGIFGLPSLAQEASIVFIPVPWDATTSYGGGTSLGPEAILKASKQIDLFDLDIEKPYEAGMTMLPISKEILSKNQNTRNLALQLIQNPNLAESETARIQKLVNDQCAHLNLWVKTETKSWLNQGKIVGIVGGDHSVPFGAIEAVAEQMGSMGILHLDAHSDTRNSYMGFQYSHASIMHNALTRIPGITKVTQVGIRDFCEDEFIFMNQHPNQLSVFFDRDIQNQKQSGIHWKDIAQNIVSTLPEKVWISFDIDGLDPTLCPHTGTPVPGGLLYAEATDLIFQLAKSGRKILGFDLVEIAPNTDNPCDEWDANVGMRLLYWLSACTLVSQKKIKWLQRPING